MGRKDMTKAEKSRFIKKLTSKLRRKYGEVPPRNSLPLLEHLVLAILSENTTMGKAQPIFQRFKDDYLDWNEVRVSSLTELRELMADLPDPEHRSLRLKSALKHIFEMLYCFDIDGWRKLTIREVTKRLSELPMPSQYVTARVVRDGMGGNMVPLDTAAMRVLARLGLAGEEDSPDRVGASLARILGKGKSFEFTHLVAELASDACIAAQPRCRQCGVSELCPTGQQLAQPVARRPAADKKTATRRKKTPASKSAAAKKRKTTGTRSTR